MLLLLLLLLGVTSSRDDRWLESGSLGVRRRSTGGGLVVHGHVVVVHCFNFGLVCVFDFFVMIKTSSQSITCSFPRTLLFSCSFSYSYSCSCFVVVSCSFRFVSWSFVVFPTFHTKNSGQVRVSLFVVWVCSK